MKKFTKGCVIITSGIVLAIICLAIFGSFLPESEPDTKLANESNEISSEIESAELDDAQAQSLNERTQTEPTPTETVEQDIVPTSEPIVDNAPAFDEFCFNSTTAGKTEVQWDAFKEQTVGSYFVDRVGVVRDVDQRLLGGYDLQIDIGNSYSSCSLEVRLGVTEEESLSIEKGQYILFGGVIGGIAEMFSGVTIHLFDGYFNNDPDVVGEIAKEFEPAMSNIGEAVECGEYFTVTVLEPPEITQSIGYGNTALGKYYIIKLEVINNGSKTISGFDETYFTLVANLDSKSLEFAADWSPSYYAAKRTYGYSIISDDVPPSLSWKTQVAFDTNPEATDFVFVFSPRDNYFDSNAMCSVRVSLSK